MQPAPKGIQSDIKVSCLLALPLPGSVFFVGRASAQDDAMAIPVDILFLVTWLNANKRGTVVALRYAT